MKTLIRLLIKKKLKISLAESCSGGLLASKITSVSGASKIFSLALEHIPIKQKLKFKSK